MQLDVLARAAVGGLGWSREIRHQMLKACCAGKLLVPIRNFTESLFGIALVAIARSRDNEKSAQATVRQFPLQRPDRSGTARGRKYLWTNHHGQYGALLVAGCDRRAPTVIRRFATNGPWPDQMAGWPPRM